MVYQMMLLKKQWMELKNKMVELMNMIVDVDAMPITDAEISRTATADP